MAEVVWAIIWFSMYVAALFVIVVTTRYDKTEKRSDSNFYTYVAEKESIKTGLLIMSLGATAFSSFYLIGMPGFVFTHGAVLWPYVIFGDTISLIGVYFIAKRLIERKEVMRKAGRKVVSPFDIITPNRFGKTVYVTIMLLFVFPFLSVQIAGFGRLAEETTGGTISAGWAGFLTLILIWLYSSATGLRGVLTTDAIQGTLLFSACIGIACMLTFGVFDGPTDMLGQVVNERTEHLSAPGPKGFGTYPVLISSMIVFLGLFLAQPQFLTRYHLITDTKSLKRTIFGLGMLVTIFTLPVLFIGLGGSLAYPELTSGDQLVGRILTDHFPVAIKMLISIAILAAAMSTADSILFALGTLIDRDILNQTIGIELESSEKSLAARTILLAIAFISYVIGIGSTELLVPLATLSFMGTLQLVPGIFGGLFYPDRCEYAGPASALVGVALLLGMNYLEVSLPWGVLPAVPAFVFACVACIVLALVFGRVPRNGAEDADL